MKKLLKVFTAVIAVAAMCVLFSACSSNVSGNTYTFYDVEISGTDEDMTEYITYMKEEMDGAYLTFNSDGTCVTGQGSESNPETYEYEQDGKTVKLYGEGDEHIDDNVEMELTVDGSKLKWSVTEEGITFTMIFKK